MSHNARLLQITDVGNFTSSSFGVIFTVALSLFALIEVGPFCSDDVKGNINEDFIASLLLLLSILHSL